MTTRHLTGTFTLAGWEEDALQESPTRISRAQIDQTWAGDAEGTVVTHNLMHYAPDGTAVIAGVLRFTGTVDGRKGSFAASGQGAYDGELVRTDLVVAPGSGTDDLAGVSGTASFSAPKGPEGTWTLELDL